jgi:hypothetical protein
MAKERALRRVGVILLFCGLPIYSCQSGTAYVPTPKESAVAWPRFVVGMHGASDLPDLGPVAPECVELAMPIGWLETEGAQKALSEWAERNALNWISPSDEGLPYWWGAPMGIVCQFYLRADAVLLPGIRDVREREALAVKLWHRRIPFIWESGVQSVRCVVPASFAGAVQDLMASISRE